MTNRLSVFFFYDKDGIVRDFVSFFLKSLKEVSKYVFVVSNGEINDSDKTKITKYADELFIRDNIGFDVWAYKDAFDFLTWRKIYEFDELVIANFTCYGPIYPFQEMFNRMDKSECDFWGAVKHPEQPNFLLPNNVGYINEHIMSYFMVIKNSLLKSSDFKNYWDTVPYIRSKTESTALHEVVFTKHFEDLGYRSDSYVDLAKYEGSCYNSSIIKADELLIKDRCPLLKRRAFIFPLELNNIRVSVSDHAKYLIEYIRKNTQYDTNMIWDDILSTTPLSILNANLKPLSISDVDDNCSKLKYKHCVVILISKNTPQKVIEIALTKLSKDYFALISLEKGCECDLSLLKHFVSSNNYKLYHSFNNFVDAIKNMVKDLLNYDIVSLLKLEKHTELDLSIPEEDFYDYCCEIVYGNNASRLYQCAKLSDSAARIGLLTVNPVSFSQFWGKQQGLFKFCLLNKYKKIFNCFNFSIPFEKNLLNNTGMVYSILRSDLLEFCDELDSLDVENELKDNSIILSQVIQLWLQNRGKFTQKIITSKYASIELSNLDYIHNDLVNTSMEKNGKGCFYYSSLKDQLISTPQKIIETTSNKKAQFEFRSKYDICKFNFTIGDSIKILSGAISRKVFKKKKASVLQKKFSSSAYIIGTSIVEDEVSFLVQFGNTDSITPFILLGDLKVYPCIFLTQKEKELLAYNNSHSKGQSRWFIFRFSVNALFKFKRMKMCFSNSHFVKLDFVNHNTVYNLIDFIKYKKYVSIYDGELFCLSKFESFQLGYSKLNKLFEKFLFTIEYINIFKFAWLFSENEGANDNAYELFKYAVKNTNHKCFYIASSKDIVEPEYRKHCIIKNSFEHFLWMNFASKVFSSFTYIESSPSIFSKFNRIHLQFAHPKWYLIPHGMFVDKKTSILHKLEWGNPERLYSYNKFEQENWIKETEISNVKSFGFPRFLKWKNVDIDENEIFIFFTWRQEFNNKRIDRVEFQETFYYKNIIKLINSLTSVFPNKRIIYAFHHELVRHSFNMPLHEFICSKMNKNLIEPVYYYYRDGIDLFNYHFSKAKYLITDLSSVAYDFASKKDSVVINYINDEFISGHYSFSPVHEVGNLAYSIEDILSIIKKGKNSELVNSKRDDFFVSCDKTCENIIKDSLHD